jgi:CBS domain-containing protein
MLADHKNKSNNSGLHDSDSNRRCQPALLHETSERNLEVVMNVAECMTKDALVVEPEVTLRTAAAIMADSGVGMVLVGTNERLVGMVTDRDIVVRGIAAGRDVNTSVQDVMSDPVKYCFEDETVEQVAESMAAIQMRRLPVLNRARRLVGIVSLGDLAKAADCEVVGTMVRDISLPPGLDSRAAAA